MTTTPPAGLANATIRGAMWAYVAKYGGKLVVLVTTVILARLLSQNDFGLAGYALTVISLLDVFELFGIGWALVYFPKDDRASNTAFWTGLAVNGGIFAAAWVLAPLAGSFFRNPEVVPLTRVLALSIPIGALGSVHGNLLRKDLLFRRKLVPELARTVGKGVVSIGAASMGLGVWSLVYGQLASAVVGVVALWIVTPWRPRLAFSGRFLGPMLSFGWKMVAIDVVNVVLKQVDYLLIGRYLSAVALGSYMIAFRIPDLLLLQFTAILGDVMFPAYVKVNRAVATLRSGFLETVRYVTLVTVPVGLGVALTARPLVILLFSDKWADAIEPLQAISIYGLMLSLPATAGAAYKAMGHPRTLLLLDSARLVVLVPALWYASARLQSIASVAWAQAIIASLFAAVALAIAGRMLQIPLRQIARALQPAFVSGMVLALAVSAILSAAGSLRPVAQLTLAVPAGAAAYLASLWIFERALVLASLQRVRAAIGKDAGGAPADAGRPGVAAG